MIDAHAFVQILLHKLGLCRGGAESGVFIEVHDDTLGAFVFVFYRFMERLHVCSAGRDPRPGDSSCLLSSPFPPLHATALTWNLDMMVAVQFLSISWRMMNDLRLARVRRRKIHARSSITARGCYGRGAAMHSTGVIVACATRY